MTRSTRAGRSCLTRRPLWLTETTPGRKLRLQKSINRHRNAQAVEESDYALIAMKHLARKANGGPSTSAREIAEQLRAFQSS